MRSIHRDTETHQQPAPLLVLVRDEESGWAHVAQQPRNPAKTPQFTGFLQTTTAADLLAVMAGTGYSAVATYAIDANTTTFWFAPAPPPGTPRALRRPAAAA